MYLVTNIWSGFDDIEPQAAVTERFSKNSDSGMMADSTAKDSSTEPVAVDRLCPTTPRKPNFPSPPLFSEKNIFIGSFPTSRSTSIPSLTSFGVGQQGRRQSEVLYLSYTEADFMLSIF